MKCKNCKTEHNGNYGSGRFCSQKCAKGFSTKEKRKEINKKISLALGGTGISKKCLNCGKIIKSSKYCSPYCGAEYRKKQFSLMVEEIGYFPNLSAKTGGSSVIKVKEYLAKKNGRKCSICGRLKWNKKPINLWLDHIDGNATNHKIINLRLICPNCDAQSETYCGRNRGRGKRKIKLIS